MELSPNDIRNYEFNTQMRGFDKEEVTNLLNTVATALEKLKQENLKLSMEVDSLKTQISGLREFEDTVKHAAIDARRHADQTVAAARKEAMEMLERAKAEVHQLVGSRAARVAKIEEQITKLELTKRSYLGRLSQLINSHLTLIREIGDGEGGELDLDSVPNETSADALQIEESTDVTARGRETIATQPSTEPLRTEEANAADEIVEVQAQVAEPEPQVEPQEQDVPVQGEQAQEESGPLDPELAAALASYRHDDVAQSPGLPRPKAAPAPAQNVMRETSEAADDVPLEFIARPQSVTQDNNTDKIHVSQQPAQAQQARAQSIPQPAPPVQAMEPNAVNPDFGVTEPRPVAASPKTATQAPINADLAHELDAVVAKFEEEMDKAARS